MFDTLPFKRGKLYKPLEAEKQKYDQTWVIDYEQKTMISNDNSGGNSYQYSYPSTRLNYINWKFNFAPVAFLEDQQKVLGEVFIEEQKEVSSLVPSSSSYGINFSQSKITEKTTRPFRVSIDVNEFIKNFELVL